MGCLDCRASEKMGQRREKAIACSVIRVFWVLGLEIRVRVKKRIGSKRHGLVSLYQGPV